MNQDKLNNEVMIKENIYKGMLGDKQAFILVGCNIKNIDIKNLSIKNIRVFNQNSNLVIIKNNDVAYIFEDLVLSIDKIDEKFEKLLTLFDAFKYKNFLKLRGDIGEAFFIEKFGGKKIENDQKYDVFLNDKYYEIKTFSISNGSITIKNSQINKNIDIIGIMLNYNNNGINIIDLANKISDIKFKEYLINEYKNSEFSKYRFSVSSYWIFYPNKIVTTDESILDFSIKYSFAKIKKRNFEDLKDIEGINTKVDEEKIKKDIWKLLNNGKIVNFYQNILEAAKGETKQYLEERKSYNKFNTWFNQIEIIYKVFFNLDKSLLNTSEQKKIFDVLKPPMVNIKDLINVLEFEKIYQPKHGNTLKIIRILKELNIVKEFLKEIYTKCKNRDTKKQIINFIKNMD